MPCSINYLSNLKETFDIKIFHNTALAMVQSYIHKNSISTCDVIHKTFLRPAELLSCEHNISRVFFSGSHLKPNNPIFFHEPYKCIITSSKNILRT